MTSVFSNKSVKEIIMAHEVQIVNYFVATGKPVSPILNFGEGEVDVKKKIKDLSEQINKIRI
jgi:hypothetical protein